MIPSKSPAPFIFAAKCFFSTIIVVISLTGCQRPQPGDYFIVPPLTSISILDRNGMSETICSPERLEQYTCADFLQPQPYQKVLRVYGRDIQGNIPACITSYHSNGTISQYLEVVNSRAFGIYREWYSNGVLKIEARIIGGNADIVNGAEKTWIFDGCCQVWNENGDPEASIQYVKGSLEGLSLYYHTDGSLWKSIPYSKNKVHGCLEIYFANGSLLKQINYCNGLREGEAKSFWSNGCPSSIEFYCDGLLAQGNYYGPQGNSLGEIIEGNGTRVIFGKEAPSEMQEYHFGLLDGEIKVLDKYGRIIKIYHMKNNLKHGEELLYYDASRLQQNLTPKLSMTWYEGKIQGITKTWYPDGTQESQKEMSNNKKHGHSTAWYRNGTMMMIEEYDQDKLVRGEYYAKGERYPVSSVEDGNGAATIFDADGTYVRKVIYWHGQPQIED